MGQAFRAPAFFYVWGWYVEASLYSSASFDGVRFARCIFIRARVGKIASGGWFVDIDVIRDFFGGTGSALGAIGALQRSVAAFEAIQIARPRQRSQAQSRTDRRALRDV